MKTTGRWLEHEDALPDELRRALRGAPGVPQPTELRALATTLSSTLGVALTPPAIPVSLSVKAAGIASSAAHKGVWAISSWFFGGIGVGVGACAIAIYGATSLHRPTQAMRTSARTVSTAKPRAAQAAAPAVSEPEPVAASTPAVSLSMPSPPAHRSGEAKASKPTIDEKPDSDSELSLLQRAQQAISHDPSQALALCTQHAQRFANGVFVQEREVLAIDALLRLGRVAEAQARAHAFDDHYPGSAHTRRIQALLNERAH